MQVETLELQSEKNRKRLVEIVYKAKAGHIGGDLSCLNVLTALYFDIMRVWPDKPKETKRDRFVMSKGHCVEALYVTLEAKGFISREVTDTLGEFGSLLSGHPTIEVPGIEVNTGALGHGLSVGVGMAMAAKMDKADYKTYVLMGDGEQGEGSIYAFLGGVVWNFGNIFLTAAIAVAGMSVGFPIGGGLAWIGGIVFNYLLISLAGQTYQGNQLLLWSGVLVIIVAILICGKAYGKLSSGKASTPKKGILLAIMAGIAIMFFYGLVVKSLDPQYVAGGTGTLTPYTGVFFFAVGILASTPIFNTFAMKHPVEGKAVTMKDYFAGDAKTHLTGMLGGFIWMGGMVISFMGAGAANPAISYALSNAAPVVAMIWGVFVWKEFKEAPKGTNKLIAAMFSLFIIGLISITLSN